MSAFDDYLQLLNNNPKMDATKQWANKLGNNVKTGIEDNLPPTDPSKMFDYAIGINPISHVASMIGSIRKPIDSVVTDNDLNHWEPDSFDKKWIKYFKTKWATDDDPLVKYVDEGGNIGPSSDTYEAVSNTHMNNSSELSLHNIHNSPHYMDRITRELSGGKINKSKFIYDDPFDPNADIGALIANDHNGDTTIAAIINRLHSNTSYPSELKHVDKAQKLADYFREIAGTNQIAKTPAGKYFENANDIKAVYSNREGDIPEKLFNYTEEYPNQNIFYPEIPYAETGIGGETRLLDKLPANINNMSLQEMVRQATKYDDNAIDDMIKGKGKLKIHQDEQLARATPVHNIGDEFTWYKVPDSKAAKVEGQIRDNCLQDNWMQKRIDEGESEIYSLRDKNGRPKVTAEFGDTTGTGNLGWVQFKGMSNSEPKAKYQPYIDSLIKDYEPYPDHIYDWLSDS